MNWNPITTLTELDHIDHESIGQPVLILKHSTSCSISAMALARVERTWNQNDHTKLKPYYLDLKKFHGVSNEIEDRYGVTHESPQVLIIRNGKCIYNTSHMDISYEEMMNVA